MSAVPLPRGSIWGCADWLRSWGGPRRLADSHGSDGWPRHGVYFFYEPGETRADGTDRVVRVGTHALTATSQATLWGRLRQHRGHWPAVILAAAVTGRRCSGVMSEQP